MEQVTPHIFAETQYRGCNPGFVVTSEGIVMVDTPQMPTDALKYREEILKKGEVRYLINTEPHGDHFMGNCFFGGIGVAHEETRNRIVQTDMNAIKERMAMMDPGFTGLDSFTLRPPSITFTQSMKIYCGDHEFVLLHLPGHTFSETAVFVPQERVVFTGDNIFYNCQTFFQEALPKEWLQSLKTLKALEADFIIPGHGEICKMDYIDEQAAFIEDWIAAVKNAVEKGWSLEEAQERISFLDRYPMLSGMADFGPQLQKTNVGRLYALAFENRL
ncbi:MAG: MBL fold metallo-hydrolase [Proteobacteria bacterium]|nr:MBL fold metallo-hydrolase [Pseudomonadota bacterium]MBU4472366.1 MBL fold metallo-hydrolase [Pseudomonadota bacterium]MCG2752061.1 MBL fold metallo-hydrolase [Desulfobacteraceae bacterium]